MNSQETNDVASFENTTKDEETVVELTTIEAQFLKSGLEKSIPHETGLLETVKRHEEVPHHSRDSKIALRICHVYDFIQVTPEKGTGGVKTLQVQIELGGKSSNQSRRRSFNDRGKGLCEVDVGYLRVTSGAKPSLGNGRGRVDKFIFEDPGTSNGKSTRWETFFPKYLHASEHEKFLVNRGLPDVTVRPAHSLIVIVRGYGEVIFSRCRAPTFRTPNRNEGQLALIEVGQRGG